MAELFLARQTGLSGFEKQVAIKRILPALATDKQFVEMFLDEARIAAQLTHPNIVQIYDLGETDGAYFIAMEYIEGMDAESVKRKLPGSERRFPIPIAAYLVACVCDALHYAHERTDSAGRPLHIVHRDATPGNIMIGFEGTVKLVDFGIAKARAQLQRTRPGVLKGKLAYVSPEQIMDQPADARSDIFTIGVDLYELTTGVHPFDGPEIAEVLRAITNRDPPAPESFVPGYPQRLSDIVMKALEKSRHRRYATARDLQVDLQAFLAQSGKIVGSVELSAFMHAFRPQAPVLDDLDEMGEDERTTLDLQGAGGPDVRAETDPEDTDLPDEPTERLDPPARPAAGAPLARSPGGASRTPVVGPQANTLEFALKASANADAARPRNPPPPGVAGLVPSAPSARPAAPSPPLIRSQTPGRGNKPQPAVTLEAPAAKGVATGRGRRVALIAAAVAGLAMVAVAAASRMTARSDASEESTSTEPAATEARGLSAVAPASPPPSTASSPQTAAETPPEAAPVPPATSSAESTPTETVWIQLTSKPAGALVKRSDTGAVLGHTPVSAELPRATPTKVFFALPGFVTVARVVDPAAETSVSVEFTERERSVSPRRSHAEDE